MKESTRREHHAGDRKGPTGKRRFDRALVLGTFVVISGAALPIGCGGQSHGQPGSAAGGSNAGGSVSKGGTVSHVDGGLVHSDAAPDGGGLVAGSAGRVIVADGSPATGGGGTAGAGGRGGRGGAGDGHADGQSPAGRGGAGGGHADGQAPDGRPVSVDGSGFYAEGIHFDGRGISEGGFDGSPEWGDGAADGSAWSDGAPDP